MARPVQVEALQPDCVFVLGGGGQGSGPGVQSAKTILLYFLIVDARTREASFGANCCKLSDSSTKTSQSLQKRKSASVSSQDSCGPKKHLHRQSKQLFEQILPHRLTALSGTMGAPNVRYVRRTAALMLQEHLRLRYASLGNPTSRSNLSAMSRDRLNPGQSSCSCVWPDNLRTTSQPQSAACPFGRIL